MTKICIYLPRKMLFKNGTTIWTVNATAVMHWTEVVQTSTAVRSITSPASTPASAATPPHAFATCLSACKVHETTLFAAPISWPERIWAYRRCCCQHLRVLGLLVWLPFLRLRNIKCNMIAFCKAIALYAGHFVSISNERSMPKQLFTMP